MEICCVCKKNFDIEKEGGIKQNNKAVCCICIRNHPYRVNGVFGKD